MQFTKNTFLLITVLSAIFFLQGCGDDKNPFEVTYNAPDPYDISKADSSYMTEDGLEVYIMEEGNGFAKVISRDRVSAYYTGRVIENGEPSRIFDSTYRNGVTTPGILRNLTTSPISTSTGTASPLIDGFRRAILGMREGGKRVVIIPPSLGYGDTQEGQSGYNLRNDTLRFDIELDEIL